MQQQRDPVGRLALAIRPFAPKTQKTQTAANGLVERVGHRPNVRFPYSICLPDISLLSAIFLKFVSTKARFGPFPDSRTCSRVQVARQTRPGRGVACSEWQLAGAELVPHLPRELPLTLFTTPSLRWPSPARRRPCSSD
jgi:hypothetical protein